MKNATFVICFLVVNSLCVLTYGQSIQNHNEKPNTQQFSAAPPTKISPAKEANIRRLLELADIKSLAAQMMDGMEKNTKPLLANLFPPGQYREQLVELFFQRFHTKADVQQLVDMAVPVYDKYLSDEEIKGLIEFYGTPLGQKALHVLPKLSIEMQEQGRVWGEQLGRDSMKEVLSEHPELAKALEQAQKEARPQ